jgi:hypothetical protein
MTVYQTHTMAIMDEMPTRKYVADTRGLVMHCGYSVRADFWYSGYWDFDDRTGAIFFECDACPRPVIDYWFELPKMNDDD